MPLIHRSPTQQLVNLVAALGGHWHGHSAICRCPAHADTSPSLSLRQGDRGILVTCFAGCAREDVLRELSRIRPTADAPPPPVASERTQANVERLWSEARDVRGTLAARYLDQRALSVELPDIRFHPSCPHGPAPLTRFKPALLVAVREHRRLTALQRIFLDPLDGTCQAKAMIGAPGRGAWCGGSPQTTLAIAEGFETAAAFTLVHDIPCWASLGARRLPLLALPDTLAECIIAADNDVEGHRAAALAERAYQRPDLAIRGAPPPPGFNDWAEVNERSRERGGGPGR